MITPAIRPAIGPAIRSAFAATLRRAWSPTSLFSASEPGAWYDPSDFSTMFQDSAGSTPVTAVGQPVGLLLDKSKGLVLGANLFAFGEGGTSGWAVQGATVSTVGGSLRITSSSGTAFGKAYTSAAVATVAGRSYQLAFDYITKADTVLSYRVGTYAVGNDLGFGGFNTLGRKQVVFTAVSSTSFLFFENGFTTAGYNEIDNISVRELPGNHAKQATATARPVLSARVNLLTKTEDLGVAPWFNVQGASSYVGGKIVPAATTLIHGMRYTRSQVAGRKVTVSAYVKAGEAGVNLEFWNYISIGAVINLTTWVVTTVTNCTVFLGDFDGDGYRMVSFTFTEDITTNNNTDFRVTRSTLRDQQFVGDGSSGYFLKKPQVEIGAVATTYQSVNTDTDYDTVGFPHYLAFDGVDDSMVTAAINFTATDKMSVFAGVRKNANNDGMIWELSGNTGAGNPGSFYMLAPSGSTGYLSKLGGNATDNTRASTGQVPPSTNVLSNLFDMAGVAASDEHVLRINGVATGTIAGTAAGTGNFGNYPLYIGARAGTTLQFNGCLYSLIVRGAQSSLSQIEATERYIKQKMRLP